MTPHGWDQTLALNLTAPFFLSQAMVPAMKAKGWGRIVNFASLQTTRAFSGGIAYGASKAGIAWRYLPWKRHRRYHPKRRSLIHLPEPKRQARNSDAVFTLKKKKYQ